MISSASSRPTISLGRVAERLLRRAVDLDHHAGRVHRDDAVERRVEDRALARVAVAEQVLGAPALDAVADPAAEARHGVRAGRRPGRAARARGTRSRRARRCRRGSGSRTPRAGPPAAAIVARGKLRVGGHVGDPRGLSARADAARQALARREPELARQLPPRLRRLPGLDAAKGRAAGGDGLPDPARVPAQRRRRSRRAAAGRRSARRRTPRARGRPRARPAAGPRGRDGAQLGSGLGPSSAPTYRAPAGEAACRST